MGIIKKKIKTQKKMLNWLFFVLFDFILDILTFVIDFPICITVLCINYFKYGKKIFDVAKLFEILRPLPYGIGNRVLTKIHGFINPYSRSLNTTILKFTPTEASLVLSDRPWARNPFNSIHAVALTNLAEMTSGLLMVSQQQRCSKKMKMIVTSLNIEFLKKARGDIFSYSEITPISAEEGKKEIKINVSLKDAQKDEVAKVVVGWSVIIEEKKVSSTKDKKT
eukprot:c10374_g1_i1.p1 GENE.c10374_g1_i1~~c10374_g1_i1.p1  ORF type:complete len:223 (-),score=54.99 c10374_g1_i1:40-708(-)